MNQTEPARGSFDKTRALDLALAAERWIDAQSRATAHGQVWLATPAETEATDLSLYRGAAGIVLFYLELERATGERKFLERAMAGADGILDLANAGPGGLGLAGANDPGVGLYRGASGLAVVLGEVFRAGGDERHRDAARAAVDVVLERAERRGAGLGWIESIPFADSFGLEGTTETFDVSRGSAGVALALMRAAEHGLHPGALDAARAVGERLLEVAQRLPTGLAWPMMLEPVDWTAPNFSHGTAGIAYCLARLHGATGEKRFLDAALDGARHLCSIATIDGASRWIHHSNGRENLFYMGWCHGPPGTVRLFAELERQTGNAEWRAWFGGGCEAMLLSGAPETRGRGYWNNAGQCCGDAAVGELALSAWHALGDERYLDLAGRVAAWLDRASTESDGGRSWPQAEHRVQPELLEAQTGYMQGAAGIGSFLLRLWSLDSGRAVKIQIPDSPF